MHNILTAFSRVLILVGAALCPLAQADTRGPWVAPLPQYQQECAVCHIAYPVGLLPAASWQRAATGPRQLRGWPPASGTGPFQ